MTQFVRGFCGNDRVIVLNHLIRGAYYSGIVLPIYKRVYINHHTFEACGMLMSSMSVSPLSISGILTSSLSAESSSTPEKTTNQCHFLLLTIFIVLTI